MKRKFIQLLATVVLLLPIAGVQAAITCSISSPGFTTAYDPAAGSQNVTQSYVTVICSRNAPGDPTTLNYSLRANNGLYSSGNQNRARHTGPTRYVNYDLYRDSSCIGEWRTNNSMRLPVTMNLSGYAPSSVDVPYWGCIPASQGGLTAGIYYDTVTMQLRNRATGGTTIATSTFGVQIHMSSTCNITTTPAPVVFNYMSFGSALNPTTSLGVKCTSLLPYTVTLDSPATGTLLGLDYSLALLPASGVGSGIGSGSPESIHTITGTMAAGQAGTCAAGACSDTQLHTLTLTY